MGLKTHQFILPFNLWARSIKLVIEGKGRLGYLTGDTREPERGDPKWSSWKSENSMVMAWLKTFELKTRLWNSKQGENNVIEYYNEMRALWQELDLCYNDDWECKNDSVKYHKRMETDRVFVFLAGLNRELDDVPGRILGRMPPPSLGEVFAEVRREEGRRRVMLKGKAFHSIGSFSLGV
ncbi:hypothetical protein F511_32247 [Dorcoceras hygrometricum]|uniref:Retrotransposon gag domain-containing protein n=1 Tax=Dorcoceras hygrometricum TaxID=472368 RepID=A0A2Z7A2N9_9LAMI|nr:hypothetical protein F511_32247 [Dorcoceras hygrometricum]